LEFYVNRYDNYAGGSADRIGIIDNNGNGYGWIYNHSTAKLGIDKRTSYSGTTAGYVAADNIKDDWVFASITIPSTGDIEAKSYFDEALSGETSFSDDAHTVFTKVYIFGGHDYHVDQVKIRRHATIAPEYLIDVEEQRFVNLGVLTSHSINTNAATCSCSSGLGVNWGKVTFESTEFGVSIKVRSSDDASMDGSPIFDDCVVIVSEIDISENTCVSDGHRFIQYQVTLVPKNAETPKLYSIEIDYAPIESESLDLESNAGPDLTIAAGKTVELDGKNSKGEDLIYNWAVVSGRGSIEDPTSSTPTYVSVDNDLDYNAAINLTVRSETGERSTDEAVIHVIAKPRGEEIDSPVAGSTLEGILIYETISSEDGNVILELSLDDSSIRIPHEVMDYAIAVTDSDRLIIGTPEHNDTIGTAYFFVQSSSELSGEINVLDAAVFDIALTEIPLISEDANVTDGEDDKFPTLLAVSGKQPGDFFGKFLATGDFGSDNAYETIVGAPGVSEFGGAYVFRTARQITGLIQGSEEYPFFSSLVANILEGSGDDIIIGPNNPSINQNLSRDVCYER